MLLILCLVILCMIVKPNRLETFLPMVYLDLPQNSLVVLLRMTVIQVLIPQHKNIITCVNLHLVSIDKKLDYMTIVHMTVISKELYLTQNNLIPKNQPPQSKPKLLLQPTNVSTRQFVSLHR